MNLPAHLQDLIESGEIVGVTSDNCKGHRVRCPSAPREVLEQGICCVQRDDCWNDSSSSLDSLPSPCRWETKSRKGDKAPTLKSRQHSANTSRTSLLEMMKHPTHSGSGRDTAPRPPLAHSIAILSGPVHHDQDAGYYLGSILDQLDMFSDL
mmetsp:Transcript_84/g.172  ORF Transcript_84/g.172 Transcript_84/m.172 type:complete len:152 (-) Transcript_84:133-588(-)